MEVMNADNLDHLNSDEEYDDLDSGHEASYSDSNHSASGSDSDNNVDENAPKNVVYGNFGWADAMSKVLNTSKPKTKKSVILAKAKLDIDVIKTIEAKEAIPFEIVGEKVKETKEDVEEAIKRRKAERAERLRRREQRREWDLIGRVIPSITEDREKEKTLAKIGTKGVVQLFNSVKIQQKTIQDKLRSAGPLERKREKALKSIDKSDFMDLLQGKKPVKIKTEPPAIKQEKSEATWSVLRDDFMPQATMRNWDKQSSSDSDES